MSDIEPEHNGLQPELNGSQPAHNGIPPGPCRLVLEPDDDAMRRGEIAIVGLTPRISNLADHIFRVLGKDVMLCFRITSFLPLLERVQQGFLFILQFEMGGHFRMVERELSELELADPSRPVRKRRRSASQ